MKNGFDNGEYVLKQSQSIMDRINKFGGKLYLEFGGKLFDDKHAARVLPGFDENVKIRLLKNMKEQTEVIVCINAKDIIRNKIRADFGISYSSEVLRVIDGLRGEGIYVSAIVITMYVENVCVDQFRAKLLNRSERVFVHYPTKGYPQDVDTIVSDEGYGKNAYIPTTRPLVVVTAPGPGSGKLATCLSQLYHEYRRGNSAGYAKFETFPIWNLPVTHPVNVAYEAATADLKDVNMTDYYHKKAYGTDAVNYNRDLESFPLVSDILKCITGEELYASPTDMGVNTIGFSIKDDSVCRYAASQEIIRRYYAAKVDFKNGTGRAATVERLAELMKKTGVCPSDRPCVSVAVEREKACGVPVTSIELPDGRLITGKRSRLLTSSSAVLINALKTLAGIPDEVKLLPEVVIQPILALNKAVYQSKREMMTAEQVLVALSVSQAYDANTARAMEYISRLKGSQAHATNIPSHTTQNVFRRLNIDLTSEDVYSSDDLYVDR